MDRGLLKTLEGARGGTERRAPGASPRTTLEKAPADCDELRADEARARPAMPAAVRLHAGACWTLEEQRECRLVTLLRTPVAMPSLAELGDENREVLLCLTESHREYALVIDLRRAPAAPEPGFEGAMARLRSVLTGHFLSTAIFLESESGKPQVTRFEREPRRPGRTAPKPRDAVPFEQRRS